MASGQPHPRPVPHSGYQGGVLLALSVPKWLLRLLLNGAWSGQNAGVSPRFLVQLPMQARLYARTKVESLVKKDDASHSTGKALDSACSRCCLNEG